MKQIENIGETLKKAFEGPPNKRPLRRHHDDDYWDRVELNADGARLSIHIVPRYKTSGLSGDEWRVSAVLEVFMSSATEPFFSRRFHRMKDALMYGPKFLYSNCRSTLDCKTASLIVQRKGVTLFQQWFPTFGDAAMGLAWHILIANEGTEGVEWHHLTSEEERARCQQVGCSDPPVNVYRLKKLQVSPSEGDMKEPAYDFVGQYTWYCARHTERGDCGLEDADENLVLVDGAGVPRVHAGDESPSAFGGVIEITKSPPRST